MSDDRVRFDFSGARVLVTGGSNGIGLGIARAFDAAGAAVIITGTRAAASDYDHDLSAFAYRSLDLRDGKVKPKQLAPLEIYENYLKEIGAVVDHVDKLDK